MRRTIIVRALQLFFLVVFVLLSVLAFYTWQTWDRSYDEVTLPEAQASTDPAVIARGEYLVYGPAHCVECHAKSFEEFQKVANNEKVPLQGGTKFTAPPLGSVYSKNLTPDKETGIGRYTDRQIARMMRYNVRPNGRASIAPMMPFHNMSDEDMIAIISFLRSQPAVRHQVPELILRSWSWRVFFIRAWCNTNKTALAKGDMLFRDSISELMWPGW